MLLGKETANNMKQKDALADWLIEQKFTVFGTLKYTDGYNIHDKFAEKSVCKFFNILDRAYYGNAVTNNNVRHNRVVFLHKGSSNENTHYHFLAKPATSTALFCSIARKQWAGLDSHTMGFLDTQIGLIEHHEGAEHYMLHEYRRLGADTIFTRATHLNTTNVNVSKYRNMHQLRRLIKLDSVEQYRLINGKNIAAEYIAA